MIIKFIPETDAEKSKHKEVEYSGVKEFFVFGNRKDADGYLVDFHEWEGGYRYLLGSLNFFYNEINDERREGNDNRIIMQTANQMKTPSGSGFIKRGDTMPLEIIENEENNGEMADENDQQLDQQAPDIENEFPEDEKTDKSEKTIKFPNVKSKFNAKDIESFIKNANKKYGKNKNEEE